MLLAKDAVEGRMYLSKTGMKVKRIGVSKDGKIIMKSESTGHEIRVNPEYPLKEVKEEPKQAKQPVNSETKQHEKKENKPEKVKSRTGVTLASVIDPMLFEGKMTVNEIVDEVEKTGLFKGKDAVSLNANVRARLANYKRVGGYKIEKTADKKVKIIKE